MRESVYLNFAFSLPLATKAHRLMPMKNLTPIAKKIILSVIAAVIAIGGFCLIFFLRRDLTFRGASDASFVVGAVYIVALLYVVIRRLGTFDVVEYAFYRLGESFTRRSEKRYPTAYDFTVNRQEKRQKKKLFFWPILIIASIMLIAGIVCAAIFNQSIQTA